MKESDKSICVATGKIIRTLRKQNKWSQEELASKLNISRSQLAQHELGMVNMPYKTLMKYADIFGVSPDYLLGTSHNYNVFNEFLGIKWTQEENYLIKNYLQFLLSERRKHNG